MPPVTRLYRHDCPRNCCPKRWSPYPNHDEALKHLTAQIAQDPIVHRHEFHDNKWKTFSFKVQSPLMKEILGLALANYQDFDPELQDWTFSPPFQPVVHRWDRLNDLRDSATDPERKQAATELVDFLRPILGPSVDALAKTKKTGKVTFDDLWQIFTPGELATTAFFDVEAACRMTKYERKDPPNCQPPYYIVHLEYLDWNGDRCGYASTKVTVGYFEGFRHVVSLPVAPLYYNRAAEDTRRRLVERGRKFESLRGYHFQSCVGTKILLETKCPEERPVEGRVIIDAHAYYASNNIVKPKLGPLGKGTDSVKDATNGVKYTNGRDDDSINGNEEDSDEDISDADSQPAVVGPSMTAVKANRNNTRAEVLDHLTDEQCLLATPWAKGLDLKTKEWAEFCIDDLSPVAWNDAAFDHLVLPGNEKQLSWDFVENKALANNNFDDFVQDKGRGIIILMFGPPGVGKTYTAEAVAERARVPLYSMSAGTLGTVPKEVEAALDRALGLCKLWNAMLLLDEADVFLGSRSTADLARNELVAVFLTKLEYYAGVCFLTTNRVSTIDQAFQSRVDLFLRYEDLTPSARRQVWDNFIARVGRERFSITDADLDKLAELKLNGREIKNLIKSAHLLSLKGQEKIDMARLWMLADNRISTLTNLKTDGFE
ncbi:P-loop containing nucleoside triphosphate hydrolase protein [Plectosphaerella plurivora]|uniref:P-loop containing nucleoside triphosphate hydrolase protein n=1 Tax=Plectosphaerella plurivora TaxID=936078 RepID=A0A9P8VIB3_9PEZI|nr:P-loop containing nucleoside triphosphate hydrolase protein [Plectosphaerella plurivora]